MNLPFLLISSFRNKLLFSSWLKSLLFFIFFSVLFNVEKFFSGRQLWHFDALLCTLLLFQIFLSNTSIIMVESVIMPNSVITAITISADLSIFHFIWNQFTKICIEVSSFFNEPLTSSFSPRCLFFLVKVAMVAVISISNPLSSTDSGVVGLLFKISFNSSFNKFFISSSVVWLGFRFRFPQRFWNFHHF